MEFPQELLAGEKSHFRKRNESGLEGSNWSVFQSKSLDSQKNGKKGSGEV